MSRESNGEYEANFTMKDEKDASTQISTSWIIDISGEEITNE
jgi:hypothetical protein